MANISKWSNVSVYLGSLGSAVAISDITKANPGVVYHAGSARTSGEYLALVDIAGMAQVFNRVFRVASPASVSPGPTFQLEGENTSNYSSFTSGSLKPITFSYAMSGGTTVNVSGGDTESVEITTIHDVQRRELPNLKSALTFAFDCFWDPTDSFLTAAASNDVTQTLVALEFIFNSTGYRSLALGYITASVAPTGSAGEVVKTPVVFKAGVVTNYTS